jgi:hypothetical protein
MQKRKSSILKPLAIGGAIAALIFGIPFLVKAENTTETADKMTFDVVAIRWGGFKNFKINFTVDLDFFNPTKNPLIIDFLHLAFKLVNGFTITTIEKASWNFSVNPQQTTKMTLPVEISGTQILSLLVDGIGKLLQTKKPENIHVVGWISANGFTVNVDKTINVF